MRRGWSQRAVARRFRISLATVQRWLKRAGTQRLTRVDWTDRSSRPQRTQRLPRSIEAQILSLRRTLKEDSVLGEFGAARIQEAMRARVASGAVPSVRTIGRALLRCGALDGVRRVRRPAPPRGWYLPAVATGAVELDSFDFIEGLTLGGDLDVEVFTGMSLHSGYPTAWPAHPFSARMVLECLEAHWRVTGLPGYAQFDNDTRFQGAHHYRDSISRVVRLCLSLRVVPVFAPPREPGFQNAVENFNGRWQRAVWRRHLYRSYRHLARSSDQYLRALRGRLGTRTESAPARTPFPDAWTLDLQRHPVGQLIYLRRTNDVGALTLLGHRYIADPLWRHRLVRCEVDLDAQRLRFFQLRRREPDRQPLLNEVPYHLPRRRFHE